MRIWCIFRKISDYQCWKQFLLLDILNLFLKKLILLFSKDASNWSNVTVKTFIMWFLLQVNAVELSIHQRIVGKKDHGSHKNIKQFSTLIIRTIIIEELIILEWVLKDHVSDTEDWSNDAEFFFFKCTMYSNRKSLY